MVQRRFLRVVSVGCAVFLSTSSWAWATAKATTVEPSQGVVLMNTGKGFKQIKKTTKAKVGDSVMVSPDGTAKIAYSDGCIVNVQPGAVATIAQLSPCASGSNAESDRQNYSVSGTATLLAVGGLFAGVGYLAAQPSSQ